MATIDIVTKVVDIHGQLQIRRERVEVSPEFAKAYARLERMADTRTYGGSKYRVRLNGK